MGSAMQRTENDIRVITGLIARCHYPSISKDERFRIERLLLSDYDVKIDNPTDTGPNCPDGGQFNAQRIAA